MTKKTRVAKPTVPQAAAVVARRQYMPTQNGAANSMGTTQVSCNCLNTSINDHEMSTAPTITIPPVIRPSIMYCFSEALGLMKAA